MKSKQKIRTANRPKEEELIEKKEWLSDTNWQELLNNYLNQISNFISNFQKTTNKIPLEICFSFQIKLFILCLLVTGQRLQVILEMKKEKSLNFHTKEGFYYITTGKEKTERKNAENGITIPYWLGFALNFFQEKIHPLFEAKEDTEAFWLLKDGTSMGKHISKAVTTEIEKSFAGAHITPLQFRRLAVTKMMEKNMTYFEKQNQKETFIQDLANFLNTSSNVMQNYYNRSSSMNANRTTSTMISNIHQNQTSKDLIEKLEKQAKEQEDNEINLENKKDSLVFSEEFESDFFFKRTIKSFRF
jgi:hypothetical protein